MLTHEKNEHKLVVHAVKSPADTASKNGNSPSSAFSCVDGIPDEKEEKTSNEPGVRTNTNKEVTHDICLRAAPGEGLTVEEDTLSNV